MLVIMLLLLIVTAISIYIYINSDGYSFYAISSYSMNPTLKVNDIVIAKKVDVRELEEKDIIVFVSEDERYIGKIITHRINKIKSDENCNLMFETKGDNNNISDATLIKAENIKGKVVFKIPKLGYLTRSYNSNKWVL